jgi:hypothetical protein
LLLFGVATTRTSSMMTSTGTLLRCFQLMLTWNL